MQNEMLVSTKATKASLSDRRLRSIYLEARSSLHRPLLSRVDACFDLCFLLQYVATLHWRHIK
jgi:hypothetical protein